MKKLFKKGFKNLFSKESSYKYEQKDYLTWDKDTISELQLWF